MMFRKDLYIPCTILGGVWLFHILYFIFGVKKYKPKKENETEQSQNSDCNIQTNRLAIANGYKERRNAYGTCRFSERNPCV